ncbi:MAG: bifunctional folylpolyglutamate synthase/dihydrofolate synthase [Proteobacteria bacterium]|nr:bifunctional folylpolyglutamate synthase/dihydrofolate synthase [Pseudomonadota bacterium]MBU1714862.1 bifunctional folylpolyglutamate synthase/dihydrofolate synthase [Pseudomonadota bacterium]
MNYQEAWTFLDNLQFFKIKLGLDSMNGFLDSVGHPQRNLKFVHVAGTNGKGSVSVTLLSLLVRAGYRVGLYTSPHLSSVRERFRLNDSFISEEKFAELASRIVEVLAGRQITYFEFTTALALLWFAEQQVDLVILEVGLGGRLDATNVITPEVSVITNVSMDHEAYLGNTLKEVAFEKAGIIKPRVPVVSAVTNDDSLLVVAEKCRELNSPFYLLGRDFKVEVSADRSWSYRGIFGQDRNIDHLSCLLPGRHQIDNSALALAVLDLLANNNGFKVSPELVREVLPTVKWPGRLEYFCLDQAGAVVFCLESEDEDVRHYLLDGAHNPGGVKSLALALAEEFEFDRLIMVWGSMTDKDILSSLAMVAPLCDQIIFTRPEGERAADADILYKILPAEFKSKALLENSVVAALAKAQALASGRDLICVAGSLYLIGAVRKLLLGEIIK